MKKPTPKPRAPRKPTPARPRTIRTPAERKAKAIELCLHAVAGGWTLRKFCFWSRVSKAAILRWMAEDTVQPRFMKSMQVKALALPDEVMELVQLLRKGGEYVTEPDPDKVGAFRKVWRPVDPKAIGVAIRHYEFRMMRELKSQYAPNKTVTNVTEVRNMTDEQIDAKMQELVQDAVAAAIAARMPTIQ